MFGDVHLLQQPPLYSQASKYLCSTSPEHSFLDRLRSESQKLQSKGIQGEATWVRFLPAPLTEGEGGRYMNISESCVWKTGALFQQYVVPAVLFDHGPFGVWSAMPFGRPSALKLVFNIAIWKTFRLAIVNRFKFANSRNWTPFNVGNKFWFRLWLFSFISNSCSIVWGPLTPHPTWMKLVYKHQ